MWVGECPWAERLEFANTYHLAYRDLPEIFKRHVSGTRRLDFGCGAGRLNQVLCRPYGTRQYFLDIADPADVPGYEMAFLRDSNCISQADPALTCRAMKGRSCGIHFLRVRD